MTLTWPLSTEERGVVAQVLASLDCPETESVTAYLDRLRVDGASTAQWITFVSTPAPDPSHTALTAALGVLANSGVAIDVLSESGDPIGGIRLHVQDGTLSSMNFYLLSGEEPASFPRLKRVQVQPWRTRPLTSDEHSVLSRIISALPDPQRLAFLAQLEHTSVAAGSIATMTDLVMGPEAVPVASGSPLDVEVDVVGPDGDYIGGIVIFLDLAGEGYLGAIDYHWYGDLRPEVFPRPHEVFVRGGP